MTLLETLGFARRAPSLPQILVQRAASTPRGAWLLSKILHPIDRLAFALTRDRWSVTTLLGGVPVVVLTTINQRGRTRSVPLMGVPLGDALAVIGTNFGQPRAPAWIRDLAMNARATVAFRGRTVGVSAREASGSERESALAVATAMYPGIASYAERARRDIRVFVLEPAS